MHYVTDFVPKMTKYNLISKINNSYHIKLNVGKNSYHIDRLYDKWRIGIKQKTSILLKNILL